MNAKSLIYNVGKEKYGSLHERQLENESGGVDVAETRIREVDPKEAIIDEASSDNVEDVYNAESSARVR